ncbi:MAG: hypothetical protein QOE61_5867 [Micromonosporaceae bacterium]|nr:hypothetical protein [Micromonosporaceae bacterium]
MREPHQQAISVWAGETTAPLTRAIVGSVTSPRGAVCRRRGAAETWQHLGILERTPGRPELWQSRRYQRVRVRNVVGDLSIWITGETELSAIRTPAEGGSDLYPCGVGCYSLIDEDLRRGCTRRSARRAG